MADNKFSEGPGGRLQRAQADATRVAERAREPIIPGRMLPAVEITAPAIVEYDKINYLNPFDWKYAATLGLKQIASRRFGNDIERGGPKRESYSDLINRLEQTPGTLQNRLKNSENSHVNRRAAAIGDVLLDPLNRVPIGRYLKKGAAFLAPFVTNANRSKRLLQLGNAAPYIDAGGDIIEGVESYGNYPDKPRFYPGLTPQQEDVLQKISQYNFGNVK